MDKFEECESVVFENQGQKLFGVVHRPIKPGKVPGVLLCHGLAGHKTGRYRIYVALARQLSKAGIASFRFDFRGSGDSEGEFGDVTLHGEVSDALKALENFQHLPFIDTSRIGIFGRSLGGTVAIITAALFEKAKSIALWAPIYSGDQWKHKWDLILNNQVDERQGAEMRRINGQVAGHAFFEELFALEIEPYLNKLDRVPLLHIHGKLDEVVYPEHALCFEKFRKKSIADSKFILLPHSDHDFTHPEEQVTAIEETTQWFLNL